VKEKVWTGEVQGVAVEYWTAHVRGRGPVTKKVDREDEGGTFHAAVLGISYPCPEQAMLVD
jgi:hypothetical protein